jgi:hypothetical protein
MILGYGSYPSSWIWEGEERVGFEKGRSDRADGGFLAVYSMPNVR